MRLRHIIINVITLIDESSKFLFLTNDFQIDKIKYDCQFLRKFENYLLTQKDIAQYSTNFFKFYPLICFHKISSAIVLNFFDKKKYSTHLDE